MVEIRLCSGRIIYFGEYFDSFFAFIVREIGIL